MKVISSGNCSGIVMHISGILATIQILQSPPSGHEGRKGPIASGYLAKIIFKYDESELGIDGMFLIPKPLMFPNHGGSFFDTYAYVFWNEAPLNSYEFVKNGAHFSIYEGFKLIGQGTVRKIYNELNEDEIQKLQRE